MKYEYFETPENMKGLEAWGFNWLEFVTTIPSPMFLVTTYKSNGQPNACMQSWATFTTADKGSRFFVLLTSVNKGGHLYKTLQEKECAVVPRIKLYPIVRIYPCPIAPASAYGTAKASYASTE